MRWIYRNRYAVCCTVLLLTGLATGCANEQTAGQEGEMTQAEQIERGEYLVKITGCNDCHSPKVFVNNMPMPDTTRLLSGHPADLELPEIDFQTIQEGKWMYFNKHLTAYVGPWGVSFAANLTPHETGMGVWNEEVFIRAMRTGKHMWAGRPILPPMPWFNLAEMKENDLKAMFAYLQTIKPIDNPVPAPISPEELMK